MSYNAILLMAFGGPASPEEILPFLARVTHGVAIPAPRSEAFPRHNEAGGGKLLLNRITCGDAGP